MREVVLWEGSSVEETSLKIRGKMEVGLEDSGDRGI